MSGSKFGFLNRMKMTGYTIGHGCIGRRPYKAAMLIIDDSPVGEDHDVRPAADNLLKPPFDRYEL